MKKSMMLVAIGLLAASAGAQEIVGRVISSTPVVQQVLVPRQVCGQAAPGMVPQATTGAGGVIGAIAGGVIGNQIGGGSGRAAATALGVIGGALLGNQVEAGGGTYAGPTCVTESTYENRTVAYNVTYEFNGTQHTVQMPNDPGSTIRLQVSPVGTSAYASAPVTTYAPIATPYAALPPVIVPPTVVYPAAYPYYRPYPPAGVTLSIGGYYGPRYRRHPYYWR